MTKNKDVKYVEYVNRYGEVKRVTEKQARNWGAQRERMRRTNYEAKAAQGRSKNPGGYKQYLRYGYAVAVEQMNAVSRIIWENLWKQVGDIIEMQIDNMSGATARKRRQARVNWGAAQAIEEMLTDEGRVAAGRYVGSDRASQSRIQKLMEAIVYASSQSSIAIRRASWFPFIRLLNEIGLHDLADKMQELTSFLNAESGAFEDIEIDET